jgi:succinate dehydrogenase/fumarate reductase flavoprotein subunit
LLPFICTTTAQPEADSPCVVVVVGGGLAGLSAAVEAASYFSRANLPSCSVTLVDKEQRIGGNSAKASSGINAAHTPEQVAAGVADSVATFAADTAAAGGGHGQPELLKVLAEDSVQVIRPLAPSSFARV